MAVILTTRNLRRARLPENLQAPAAGNDNVVSAMVARGPAAQPAPAGQPPPAVPPAPLAQPDDALAKILKMVPGEAAVAYTAGLAIGTRIGDPSARFLPPTVFILCAVLVPLLIRRDGKRHTPPVSPEPEQYVFQLLAFAAWAFSIGNPLEGFGLTIPRWIPSIVTIFIPIFGGLLMTNQEGRT